MAQYTLDSNSWQRRYGYASGSSWLDTVRLVAGDDNGTAIVGRYKIPIPTLSELGNKRPNYLIIEVPLESESVNNVWGVVAKLSTSDLKPNQVLSTTFNSSSSRAYKDLACTTPVKSASDITNSTVYYKISLSGMSAGATYYVYFYGDTSTGSLYGTTNSYLGDVHLYTIDTYTVSYNANGGSGTMEDSTATYGEDFITRQNQFTRTGYTFNGWNEKADDTGEVWGLNSAGVYESPVGAYTWTYTKDITLYARWTPVNYNFTINPNGGEYNGSTSNKTEIKNYENYISVGAPTRVGYTFNGWSLSSDADFWFHSPTIGHASSFSGIAEHLESVNTIEGFTNHKLTVSSAPTTDEWNMFILGDYSVSAGETITVSGWIRINDNSLDTILRIYHGAKTNDWENSRYQARTTDGEWVRLSFSRTFTSATTARLEVWTDSVKGTSGILDFDLKGISITREDGSVVPTRFSMPASDVALTAHWTPNIYKATLDKNGGAGGLDEYYWEYNTYKVMDFDYATGVKCYYYSDSECTEPLSWGHRLSRPKRAGYAFKGYYDADGTQYVDETGATVNSLYNSVSENITLYARWEESGNVYVKNGDTIVQGVSYVFVNGEYKQGITYVKTDNGYKTL